MTEQLSMPPNEPIGDETHEGNAEIVLLPPPNLSELDIEDYRNPSDLAELFSNIWLHPNVPPRALGALIAQEFSTSGTQWQVALHKIYSNMPSMDLTPEQETDKAMSDMTDFLLSSKPHQRQYEIERKATRYLRELCAVTILEERDTQHLQEVFVKLLQGHSELA